MSDKLKMDELTDAWREQIELGKALARTTDAGEREALKSRLADAKRRFDALTERYYSQEREKKEAEARKADEERRRRLAAEVEAELKARARAAYPGDDLSFEALWKSRLRDEMLLKHVQGEMTDAQRALRDQLRTWLAG